MGTSRHVSRALEGVVLAAISLILALSGGKAHAQNHPQGQSQTQSPSPSQTPAPTMPAPSPSEETPGNRVARARSLIDNLEFDQALTILATLHDDPRVAPALGAEAA